MQRNPTPFATDRFMGRAAQAFLVLASLALLALAGCGGAGGGAIDSSISNFTNTFDGVDSTNHLISLVLFPDQASLNQHAGSFDGSLSGISVDNNSKTAVSGTFSGKSLTLSLTNPTAPLAASYSGSFTDPDTIVLNGGGGTLTLRRSGGNFTASVTGSWTGTDPTGGAWYVQFGQGIASPSGQTFLVTGTELRSGITSAVSGYVSVRYVELHIVRSAGEVIVTGQFPNASGTVMGDSIAFDSGGSLARGGTPDARSVIFRGDDANSLPSLYKVDLLGLKRDQISRDPGPDAYVWEFSISPDRSMVAYTAGVSHDSTSEVFLFTVADGSTKQLTSIGASGGGIHVFWAPNNSSIAFTASTGGSFTSNVFYQKISDLAPTQISVAKTNTVGAGWSPDSCQIAYSADQDVAGEVDLYVASFCGGPSGKLAGPLLGFGTIGWFWSPAANVIAYVASSGGNINLLSVDTNTGVIHPVSAGLAVGQNVGLFQWSPNAQWIGFLVLGGSPSQDNIQAAHSDGSALSSVSGIASPNSVLLWSPDSQRLAFTYNRTAGAQIVTDLYAAAPNGGGGQLVSDPAATSGGVDQRIVWSPDSGHLLYDLKNSTGLFDFATTSVLGVLSVFKAPGIFTCGDVSAGWSPTGDRVAFFSQASATSPCNLTIAASDGSNPRMAVSASAQAALADLAWLNDGTRLLYLSTDDVVSLGFTSSATELYVAYAAGSAGIKISSNLGTTAAVYRFEAL